MKIVHTDSLSRTLDALNEAFFDGCSLSAAQKQRAAKWLAGRQGLPGSYRNMFAPTEEDFADGIRLFTGEANRTRGGTSHILGEEACRAIVQLKVKDPEVRRALELAGQWATDLDRSDDRKRGMYCCGKCSVSLWRNLQAGGFAALDTEAWLAAGMKSLRAHRVGDGKWRCFPFHYTLLALSDLDSRGALAEMRYAAPRCERLVKRGAGGDRYHERRRRIAERVLARC